MPKPETPDKTPDLVEELDILTGERQPQPPAGGFPSVYPTDAAYRWRQQQEEEERRQQLEEKRRRRLEAEVQSTTPLAWRRREVQRLEIDLHPDLVRRLESVAHATGRELSEVISAALESTLPK